MVLCDEDGRIDRAYFMSKGFNTKEFVTNCRRRMPLNQLQKHLNDHLGAVRKELVQLINDNYSDFVKLSTDMQGISSSLANVHSPMTECSVYASGFKQGLSEIMSEARSLFEERENVCNKREFLIKYKDNKQLLDNIIESLNNENSKNSTSSRFFSCAVVV